MTDNHTELFDRLYRDHQAQVYHLALGLAGNPHEAEEIVQEAFYRAFRAYDTFREESSFATWLYRITVNVANDSLRQRSKFPVQTLTEDLGYALDDIIDPNPAANPENELLAAQARLRCLHSMTECLPLEQRKVFCLAITLGLPHKLVAEILGCSVGAVKTTLHRAKQRWFGYMEDHCQLIRQSNPCNCAQWVRFGLAKGWISRDGARRPEPAATAAVKEELGRLKTLRTVYQDLYREEADAAYVQRLREGIRNREWQIFS